MLRSLSEYSVSAAPARTKRYVVAAVGKDRPGIVAAVSKALYVHGGNLEDSRMALLGDQFVILLMVSLSESRSAQSHPLSQSLNALERRMGLKIFLQPQRGRTRNVAILPAKLYLISVYGADRPGIVYRVTRWLADRGANITDLSTRLLRQRGRPVYLMSLEVQLPRAQDLKRFRGGLSRLGRALSVTLAINSVEPVTL
ncbi:MAG: amino acid-binding protein [Elusimicrobia bacterium]|nr:amino acid-binding protein [Elusimicrobiota bacterium]